MFTTTKMRHLVWGALVLGASHAQGQASVLGNSGVATDFLGWDNIGANNFPLQVRHDLNWPIEWYTNAVQRMILNENIVTGAANTYTNLNLTGHLGIGTFNSTPSPLAYLHIDNGSVLLNGYRPWMRTGALMTEANDLAYFGTKPGINGDRFDAVIAWADNYEANPNFGPDVLKFIFTRTPGGGDLASSFDGIEAGRFTPQPNGNAVFFGLGDFFTPGLQPTERLHLLDGRVRIQTLPEDQEAVGLTKVMMVDDVALPNAEHGVVKWMDIANLVPDNCEWTMNTGANNHLYTAFGGSDPNCPDDADAVAIGVDLSTITPPSKVTITTRDFVNGLEVNTSTITGTNYGVVSNITGATTLTHGFYATTSGYHTTSHGIKTISDGAHYSGYGGAFISNDDAKYTWGSQNLVNGGTQETIGAEGLNRANGVLNNGVKGTANASDGNGVRYYGVRGIARPFNSNQVAYGIHGNAPSGTNSWAVYSEGEQFSTTNSLWTTFSDASLKTDIEELDGSLDLLMQLAPKRFRYRAAEFPYLGLPSYQKLGFLAQDLEEVLPQMVRDIHIPAIIDSTGAVLQDVLDVKGINLDGMFPLMISAMQEQQQQLAEARATNDVLNDQLQEVMVRLDAMEQNVSDCCAAHGALENGGEEIDEKSLNTKDRYLRIAPNPFETQTTVFYQLEKNGRMQLLANSADGKQLQVLQEAEMEAGNYQYEWATGDLAPGVYYVTLLMDGKPVTKRAVKILR